MSGWRSGWLPRQVTAQIDAVGETILGSVTVSATGAAALPGAYTMSSWGQVVASTSEELLVTSVCVDGMHANSDSVIQGPVRVDVGVGAAGSEQVVSSLLSHGVVSQYTGSTATRVNPGGVITLAVPLRVAAARRVAARVGVYASGGLSRQLIVHVMSAPVASLDNL